MAMTLKTEVAFHMDIVKSHKQSRPNVIKILKCTLNFFNGGCHNAVKSSMRNKRVYFVSQKRLSFRDVKCSTNATLFQADVGG